MPSIRITQFAGLLPEINPKALRHDHAQIAHNCLLWDGWLRPMPQWTLINTFAVQPLSLVKQHNIPAGFFPTTEFSQAIFKEREPYTVSFVGIGNTGLLKSNAAIPGAPAYRVGLPIPDIIGITQTVTPNFASVYPIPRTYALTFMSDNSEGPPFVFPEIGAFGDLFEGDYVNLTFTINTAVLAAYKITGFRLYRTIPSFDTGEQLGNPAETGFHLVTEGSVTSLVSYTDTHTSEQIPGDLLLTDQFMEPSISADLVQETEGGWLVLVEKAPEFVTAPSRIQISERYLWDAWPPQNTAQLFDSITDMATFYDDVFFGTTDRPYHMRVEMGDNDSLNLSIRPFADDYACIPNTMVSANSGAMYASQDGLVSLEVTTDSVVSKKVTNPGDQLGGKNIRIDSAVAALWWNGNYFGICPDSVGYVFNIPNSSNNEFPLSQLVTIDVPPGIVGANVVTGAGLYSLWGTNLYNFPLPGYGYEAADKATYTWKSKRYVLPGLFTMAAAKVVNDASGTLTFTLIGDGQIILSRPVTDSAPFRIPHQHRCIEWEILLEGTSVINEVHVATSMRELTETPQDG